MVKAERDLKRKRAAERAAARAAHAICRFYKNHVRGNGVVRIVTQNLRDGATIERVKSIRYNTIVYSDCIGMFVDVGIGLYLYDHVLGQL